MFYKRLCQAIIREVADGSVEYASTPYGTPFTGRGVLLQTDIRVVLIDAKIRYSNSTLETLIFKPTLSKI